jgi:hypothetical protein
MDFEGYKILSSTINQTTLIASALITASIAIYEKILKEQSTGVRMSIRLAWLSFGLSIAAGLFCGHFISFDVILKRNTLEIIEVWSGIHFILFFLGIIFLLAFASMSVRQARKQKTDTPKNDDQLSKPASGAATTNQGEQLQEP